MAPSWQTIKELETEIRKYRHVLAHSKEIANNYVSFMDIDSDYYQTQTKIIVAGNAAMFYISGIFENLTDLYKNSRIAFEQKHRSIKKWHPHDEMISAKSEAIKMLQETNENLIQHGYNEAHKMDYN